MCLSSHPIRSSFFWPLPTSHQRIAHLLHQISIIISDIDSCLSHLRESSGFSTPAVIHLCYTPHTAVKQFVSPFTHKGACPTVSIFSRFFSTFIARNFSFEALSQDPLMACDNQIQKSNNAFTLAIPSTVVFTLAIGVFND